MHTIYSLFEHCVHNFEDRIAVVDGGVRFSYGALGRMVDGVALALKGKGVRRGSVVAMLLPVGVESVVLFYSCQRLGAVAAPLNTRKCGADIAKDLLLMQCEFFVYSEEVAGTVSTIRPEGLVEISWINVGDLIEGAAEARRGMAEWPFEEYVQPDENALFLCTSGSTGEPKVVVHTHESLMMQYLIGQCSNMAYQADDIVVNYAPFFHMAGLFELILVLSVGARLILMSKYSAVGLLELIRTETPSSLMLVPPSMVRTLSEANVEAHVDLSCVKVIHTGGATIYPADIELMLEMIPRTKILLGYGQTETGTVTCVKFGREEYEDNASIASSCGKQVAYTRVRIVDEEGLEVEDGQAGEALVRSLGQMKGYVSLPDPRVNGWLPTGDMLRKGEDGYYHFVDRKTSIIKSGGEKVSSIEVEDTLLRHPQVMECAVFGVPGGWLGEHVVAAIVKKDGSDTTEEDLVCWCKDRLSRYKAPRQVIFFSELPHSPTGKIRKQIVKDMVLTAVERTREQ